MQSESPLFSSGCCISQSSLTSTRSSPSPPPPRVAESSCWRWPAANARFGSSVGMGDLLLIVPIRGFPPLDPSPSPDKQRPSPYKVRTDYLGVRRAYLRHTFLMMLASCLSRASPFCQSLSMVEFPLRKRERLSCAEKGLPNIEHLSLGSDVCTDDDTPELRTKTLRALPGTDGFYLISERPGGIIILNIGSLMPPLAAR